MQATSTSSSPNNAPLVRLAGIRKRYGAVEALRGVDLHVDAGEVLAICGDNGAGKSSLIRVVSGAHDPDEGTIERDEYAITGYLAQESGEPTDETILEIAMSITPEMTQILRTMREYEAKGDHSHPDYAKAQDQFRRLLAEHQRRIALVVVVRAPGCIARALLLLIVAVVRVCDPPGFAVADGREDPCGAEDACGLLDEEKQRPEIGGSLAPIARDVALDLRGGRQRQDAVP